MIQNIFKFIVLVFFMDCIFCKISCGEVPSERIIYENVSFFSVYDTKPSIEGHALVISKKHFNTALDLPKSLGPELLDCIKNTAMIVIKKYKCNGFNVVNNNFESAGQIVDHVHFHILPRKKDDKYRILSKN